MYNLTDNQKDLLRWLVQQVRDGKISEEFLVIMATVMGKRRPSISGYRGQGDNPEITLGALDALGAAGMLHCAITYRTSRGQQHETSRRCTLLELAYKAVDSDFDAPDTSFVRHLSPLADVTYLDAEIKQRCLPSLSAGSDNPQMWDVAVRTAGVILEERLRDVGGITDLNRVGRDLVNDVFGQQGTLRTRLSNDSERLGYRDLYAGIVGAFRNPNAHRFTDPTPEDGGVLIVFVNFLLKRLEDLR